MSIKGSEINNYLYSAFPKKEDKNILFNLKNKEAPNEKGVFASTIYLKLSSRIALPDDRTSKVDLSENTEVKTMISKLMQAINQNRHLREFGCGCKYSASISKSLAGHKKSNVVGISPFIGYGGRIYLTLRFARNEAQVEKDKEVDEEEDDEEEEEPPVKKSTKKYNNPVYHDGKNIYDIVTDDGVFDAVRTTKRYK